MPRAEHPARSTAPQLSRFIDDFIARRGGSLSGERSQAYQAVVRDLIEVASDKPVSAYTIADAEAFEEVLRTLPANWGKKRDLKNLSMTAAETKASAQHR